MLTLYHTARSRGFRPLWTAEEMGLECELVLLPFPPRVKQPTYLQQNPMGTVPMLTDGDQKMIESAAMVEYLTTKYGPTDIALTKDHPEYARYLDFIHYGEATLGMTINPFVRFSMLDASLGLQAAGDYYADIFHQRLGHIEAQLAHNDYLCAGRFTIADISVCWPLMLARLVGLGDTLPPIISEYLHVQSQRPAYQRALSREQASIAAR